jgi:hypothetical protein
VTHPIASDDQPLVPWSQARFGRVRRTDDEFFHGGVTEGASDGEDTCGVEVVVSRE